MPAVVLSRFSYPKVPGDEKWSIADVTGPASYAVVVPGTPPTGGQKLTPADFGLQSVDIVLAMGTNNGQYSVVAFPQPYQPNDTLTAVTLGWYSFITGSQAGSGANLSGAIVRVLAIGR